MFQVYQQPSWINSRRSEVRILHTKIIKWHFISFLFYNSFSATDRIPENRVSYFREDLGTSFIYTCLNIVFQLLF